MTLTHLTPADYRRMPWKNGLGTTTEILADPPGALTRGERFLWRVSLADVTANGPFSAFPGYDRTILVAEGAGMALDFDTAPPALVAERFVPLDFKGEWTTSCRLLNGPIRDFNVMVDRARATARIRILRGLTPTTVDEQDATLLVHVFQGRIIAGSHILPAGDSLRADGADTVLRLVPDHPDTVAALIIVRPHQPAA